MRKALSYLTPLCVAVLHPDAQLGPACHSLEHPCAALKELLDKGMAWLF